MRKYSRKNQADAKATNRESSKAIRCEIRGKNPDEGQSSINGDLESDLGEHQGEPLADEMKYWQLIGTRTYISQMTRPSSNFSPPRTTHTSQILLHQTRSQEQATVCLRGRWKPELGGYHDQKPTETWRRWNAG
jgi:hypothetical protein